MCGIVGIYAYSELAPPVDADELSRINEHMHARGPDGSGLWVSENRRIGLAHRRLSIIDLTDSGVQPMRNSDTGDYITFNGEIYNYKPLRIELEQAGHVFSSSSDTEVLLKLYRAYGGEMVHKLRGMYAFAIWDNRNKSIFLARDPFGIKPLYIANDGKSLRFASQVKALIASGMVDTSPEPAGHVGFFLWGHVPEPYTLYKGVSALPAGNTLTLGHDGSIKRTEFFSIKQEYFDAADTDSKFSLESEASEYLHEALVDSVQHHLVADVPVGVFLSAGLDSATLTALVKQCGVENLKSVTLGFEEYANTNANEVPLAESLSRKFRTDQHTHWVNSEDFSANFSSLLNAMDQPSIDGVNTYFVSKAARDAGLKVAISGLGGDELFGGYSSFAEIPRIVNLVKPFSIIPQLGSGFRRISAPVLKRLTSPKYAGLIEYGGSYGGAYLVRRGLCMPWELPEVLDGDLVRSGWDELKTIPALRHTTEGVKNPRLCVSALETSWYMRNQLLRDTDWASMSHSLEVRVPLVDVPLFRAVTKLVLADQGPSKRDMASAPNIALPDVVLNRSKSGFSIPVQQWLEKGSSTNRAMNDRGLRSWAVKIHDLQSQSLI